MRKYGYLTTFIVACVLNGCGSMPHHANPDKHAYWNDPKWQLKLLNAVQATAHAPANIPSASTPGIHGTARFMFANGIIQNPEIVASTGNPNLDKLLLQQVSSAQIPKPTGPHADESHEFELLLDMPTPFEAFEYSIYAAIDYRKLYPKEGLLSGSTGSVIVDFDYLDAKASDIVVTKSSGSTALDKASISAITNAALPTAPPGYAGKMVHMEVIVCYSLNNTNICPSAKNVIYVTGTRYIRRGGRWHVG